MTTKFQDTIIFEKAVTFGDGSGSPAQALDKSASGTASLDFKAAGTLRAQALLDASENFVLKVFASNGSTLQGSLTIAQSNGMVTASNGVTITTGGLTVSAGAVAMPLSNYADDTAAAAGGIAVGQLYRTASAVKIRVA